MSFTESWINLTQWLVKYVTLAITMSPFLGSKTEQRCGQEKKKILFATVEK